MSSSCFPSLKYFSSFFFPFYLFFLFFQCLFFNQQILYPFFKHFFQCFLFFWLFGNYKIHRFQSLKEYYQFFSSFHYDFFNLLFQILHISYILHVFSLFFIIDFLYLQFPFSIFPFFSVFIFKPTNSLPLFPISFQKFSFFLALWLLQDSQISKPK